MAFAAVISVERTIEELINSPRISLSPSCKEMMEFAYQQLKSLPEVLKRLDGSSKDDCRKKVNAVDARIKEAVWEFQDLIESHVDNQMLSQSDQILRYDVHLHELRPDVDDFIQKLKKMEEEYIYELDHMMPEEPPDNAVSATTDSDVRKAFWYLCYREVRKSRFFHVLTSVADGVEENMKSQRRLSFHNNILFAMNDVHDSLEDGCSNLEVLKLRCYAFRGPKWEVKDDEFKWLNYLLVEGTDLVQLKVESGGFGWLRRLCLKHYYKLEDIQWNGGKYRVKIEVTDCSPSTEKFANKMRSIKLESEAFVHSSLKDGKLK